MQRGGVQRHQGAAEQHQGGGQPPVCHPEDALLAQRHHHEGQEELQRLAHQMWPVQCGQHDVSISTVFSFKQTSVDV